MHVPGNLRPYKLTSCILWMLLIMKGHLHIGHLVSGQALLTISTEPAGWQF